MFDIYKLIFYLLFTSHGTKWRQEKKENIQISMTSFTNAPLPVCKLVEIGVTTFQSALERASSDVNIHLKKHKITFEDQKKIIVFLLITIYIDHMIQSILNGLNVWMFSPVMGVFSIFFPCQSCVLELTIKKTYCSYDTGHLKKKVFIELYVCHQFFQYFILY